MSGTSGIPADSSLLARELHAVIRAAAGAEGHQDQPYLLGAAEKLANLLIVTTERQYTRQTSSREVNHG